MKNFLPDAACEHSQRRTARVRAWAGHLAVATLLAVVAQTSVADALGALARPRALPEGLAEPAILSAAEAFALDALPDGPGTLAVRFDVQPGYYLYRNKIAVRALGDGVAGGGDASITLSKLPDGQRRDDPVFGEVDVFPEPVAFTVQTTSPDDVEIELSYQGCAEAGVCYQPQKVRLFIGGTGP